MRKSTRIVKRIFALLLVVLMSIESFAAVVSDNDGSAFITKAEFDSLKNNFQAQIDQYNTSIDSKIDGAIASYLSGIQLSRQILIANKYDTVELATGQKIKDLKWINGNNYAVNQCDRESGTFDFQRIYLKGRIFAHGAMQDGSNGIRGVVNFYDYTDQQAAENRIELDKNNRIIAWGSYSVGFELFNAQARLYNGWFGQIDTWIPVQFNAFTSTARRPWLWRINSDHNGESGNDTQETSGAKCFETLPQDATTFPMDELYIAPLSTKNEAFLPPQPLVGDTSEWTEASGTSTSYGEKVIWYQDFTWIGSDTLKAQYHVTADNTKSGSNPIPMSNVNPRIFTNLEARWFRIKPHNDVGFKAIYDKWLFDCPIKCGMPITDSREFHAEDKVIVNVEGATSNGYLVPYVSKNPSNTWNGAKTNYAIDKYKIQQNVEKKIEIEIDEKGEYVVFVVWLPDTACVLPTLNIYHQSN